MRPSARTAIGIISKLVDVHSSLGRCIMAGDIVCNGGMGRLRGLLEGDSTSNLGVTAKNCYYGIVSKFLMSTAPTA